MTAWGSFTLGSFTTEAPKRRTGVATAAMLSVDPVREAQAKVASCLAAAAMAE
jgi:hypothetical protein